MADIPLSPPAADRGARRLLPAPALYGLLLLLVVFSVSYAVGSAAGPVAPGMHGTGRTGSDGGNDGGGMDDVPGMGHGSGE
ncbi:MULTISPECIES: hypothetical protein [unclassified Streptomyces]|uniref:hypothetical protein n=1 Tax=unclassified Streptomyces TaxID=2593676 RepID=UPI002E20BD3D|nr:hypothetical protein OG217_32185 [Streptomyces sp. NBC_01023]